MNKTNVIPTKVFALEEKNKEKKDTRTELEKLPTPAGWRLVVMPLKIKEKTKGGVLLTDKVVEESQWTSNENGRFMLYRQRKISYRTLV